MSAPLRVHDRIDSFPTERIAGYDVRPGRAQPFGAILVPGGVNFSVFSSCATAMTLVLFRCGERTPCAELPFPESFRVGGVWAMTVFGLDYERVEYGYRVYGPQAARVGDRFDPTRILADPHAKAMSGRDVWGTAPDWSDPYQYRSRLTFDEYDWEGDEPVRLPPEDLVGRSGPAGNSPHASSRPGWSRVTSTTPSICVVAPGSAWWWPTSATRG
jgi:glycogen operon protein